MTPTISILIRTFNSAKTLGMVISKLDLTSGDEVIIVDSGSTDATPEIGRSFGAACVAAPLPFNYSTSLNKGFEHANNDWVLVISSHSMPIVPDFLASYRQAILSAPSDVMVFYGPSTLSGKSDPDLPPDRITFYSSEDFPRTRMICGNGNALYRKNAWDKLKFDESKLTAEDKLWITETLSQGYRYGYVPMAKSINRNQASLRYMFMKGYRDARANRDPGHRPMSLHQLAGALKGILLKYVREKIGWGNFIRYSSHILGQFAASYRSETNERR